MTVFTSASEGERDAGLRALLRHRAYWWWLATIQLVRLPSFMASFALVLVGRHAAGTYAAGGALVTVYTITAVICGPFGGRLLDHIGPRRGAPLLLTLSALTLVGLSAASQLRVGLPLLLLLTALASGLGAGISAAMRGLLSEMVAPRLLAPAIALDATVVELAVVGAPLILAAIAGRWTPGGPLAMAFVALLAAALLRAQRRTAPAGRVATATASPAGGLWRNRPFIFWCLTSVAFGQTLGTAEIAALPLATRLGGDTTAASGLVAGLAGASIVGGLTYAALGHRLALSPAVRAAILLTLMILAGLGLSFTASWWGAIVAFLGLGICTAPLSTVRSQAAEGVVPAARKAEAFGILYALNGLGFALGGLALATLPLNGMLLVGGSGAALALLLAPFLLRQERQGRAGSNVPGRS